MLFESTALLLRNIVHSLENGEESRWDDHIESGKQCVYELFQMSRSSSRAYRTESNPKFQPIRPASERALRAIPDVKLMNAAIRKQDRPVAIEHGRAAIALLNGVVTEQRNVPVIDPTNAAEETVSNRTSRTKLAPKSAARTKRERTRVSMATSR